MPDMLQVFINVGYAIHLIIIKFPPDRIYYYDYLSNKKGKVKKLVQDHIGARVRVYVCLNIKSVF